MSDLPPTDQIAQMDIAIRQMRGELYALCRRRSDLSAKLTAQQAMQMKKKIFSFQQNG